MIVHTRISGIPCLVELEYHPPLSGSFDQPAEAEGFTIEKVMDRNGRKAQWLQDKMKPHDYNRIIVEAFDVLRGDREDAAYEDRRDDF